VVTPVGVDGHTEPAAQGTAVTTAWPAGIIDGDFVLFEVSHGSGGPPGTTIAQSGGVAVNLLSNVDDGSSKAPVFWCFFHTGDTAPSFTLGTSRSWATRSTAFRNVDPLHPFGPFDADYRQVAQPSGSTYTSATITPGEDGALVVVCWGGKIAAGAVQGISTAAGWLPTGAINQSSIAAVVNQWCHFQYRPLVVMAPISEVVTITNSAVGSGTIIALRPTGLPTPPSRFGGIGVATHPGRGPSQAARFWQTPRSTEVVTAAGAVTLVGVAQAASLPAGTLQVSRALAGAVATATRPAASLQVSRALQAATLPASRPAGTLSISRALVGPARPTSRPAATLTLQRAFQATARPTVGLASAVTISRALTAVVRPSSAATAAPTVARAFQAASRSQAAPQGTLTVTAAGQVTLAAASRPTSRPAATLTVTRALAASTAATVRPAVTLTVRRALTSAVTSSGRPAASVTVRRAVAASVRATVRVQAAVQVVTPSTRAPRFLIGAPVAKWVERGPAGKWQASQPVAKWTIRGPVAKWRIGGPVRKWPPAPPTP